MNIELTMEELNYIAAVLAERPYKESVNVMANLQRQLNEFNLAQQQKGVDDGAGDSTH